MEIQTYQILSIRQLRNLLAQAEAQSIRDYGIVEEWSTITLLTHTDTNPALRSTDGRFQAFDVPDVEGVAP